jgi:hypothetical protein
MPAGRVERARERPSASGVVIPFQASLAATRLPRLAAYIDETGDRGRSPAASPVFGMAAVLVDPLAEAAARTALARLRRDFGTPASRLLSWKADIKKHSPRALHASRVLSEVDGLKVVYVVVDKARLAVGTYADDVTLFYNVTAYAVLQRILWAADWWPGGRRQVSIRFGHVSKHDSTDTLRYFRIRHGKGATVPFELVASLNWTAASQYEMSQVADLYGGFLKEAFWPDEFGNVNGAHIVRVWHQIHRSNVCAIHLGLMPRPQSQWAKDMPWFPCQECPGP